MATPTIREVIKASASGTSASANTGAGTAIGDILICFYGSNYYTLAGMGAPSPDTWDLKITADAGLNAPHIKLYSRSVTTGGANTVTVPANLDAEVYHQTYVLTSVVTIDDGSSGNGSGTGSTSHVALSVSPSGSDDLLLAAAQALFGDLYTSAPSGMTNLTNENTATGGCLGTARQNLTSSGATGNKTFTYDSSSTWAAVLIAVAGTSSSVVSLPIFNDQMIDALLQM